MALFESAGPMPDPAEGNDSPVHLRKLVEESGLAQAEVADRIGVDARTFRRYLSGESRVPYPVQFTVQCLIAAVREERAGNNIRTAKSTALLSELAALEEELESLPGASRARQRCDADIAAITRELKRRTRRPH